MSRYQAEVRITPRAGLLDPEGTAVEHALQSLDFSGVTEVRIGRLIRLHVDAADEAAAQQQVDEMCRKLLANPVTEDYQVALEQVR